MSVGTIAVTPLAPSLGARIDGVDLTALDDETFATIHQAFLDRHVIGISGQHLTPAQLVAFSGRFGPLEAHIKRRFAHPDEPLILVLSNRTVDGKPLGARDGGSFWHSDISYRERPARGTILYSVDLPESGGDTLYTDMVQAYDDLPAAMKARLDGLMAEHDYAKADEISTGTGRAPLKPEERALVPPVAHPVVRVHPETGRKALYVSPAYTRRILGMTEAESDALLAEIFVHCLQDKYRLTYRWRAGDVVMWDNAAVMHAATTVTNPPKGHRTLWRTTVSGGPTH